MAARTFADAARELRAMTGCPEHLKGTVTVDQVYAHYQHEHLEFHHPRGGEAKFLERPLFGHYRFYLQDYADSVLRDGGRPAMERAMEHLSDQVETRAPVEFWDLRRSGHPQVFLGPRQVYDRPPKQRRLTEEELRIKSRIRLRERWNANLDVFWRAGGRLIHVPPGRNRRPW
jgi:hypothetical protein